MDQLQKKLYFRDEPVEEIVAKFRELFSEELDEISKMEPEEDDEQQEPEN